MRATKLNDVLLADLERNLQKNEVQNEAIYILENADL
jgi:hypothetical protein